ncbi:E3 ubiquitin-protein ligase Midline-1-like isoform X1 [Branchiostoma floridae x Branchiostoma japonicum]
MMPLYPRGQQRQPADSLRRRSLRSSTSVEAALRYYDAPERSRTPPPHSMYKPSAYYRRSMIDLREGYVPPSTRTEARRRETRPKEVVKTEVKSAEIKRETPVLKQVLLASTTPPLRRRSAEDLSKEKEKLAAKIAAKQEPSVTTGETQEKIHATKVIVEDVEPVEVVEKPAEQPAEVTEIELEPPRSDIKDRPPSPPPPTVVQPSQKPDTIPTDTTTPPPPPKIEEKPATIQQEQQHETTTTKDAAEPETKEEAKELPRRSVVYTAMEALESELLCPVCLDHFKSPLLLPCLHSVCSKCAQGILVHPNGDPMSKIGAASDYRDEPRSSLKCPSCRHEIILDGRGLDGLKRNLILENIIDRYKQATSVSNFPGGGKRVVPCDVCRSDPPKPAVKSCVKCELSYCETCLKLTHPTTRAKNKTSPAACKETGKTAFADHKFVVPTVDPQTKVLMCTEHREEKVNLFCVTDDTPVCSLCKLVGRHKEHEVKPLEITYNEQKEKLAKDVQELVGINTEMVHYIAKLRSLCEMVEQNFSKMEASVKDEFSRLRMIVDEREKAMVGKLHDEKARRVEDRKQQVAVYRKTLEGTTAAVTYAQEALKEPNEGCFLQTSKAISKRVRMAIDSTPSLQSSTELVDQLQLKHFQIDFSNLVPMLGQLDFLRLPSTPEFLTDQCSAEESSVYLRWQCKDVSAFDTYQVQYARSYASSAIVSSIYKTISDINDVRTTISGLQPDTQYTFFVRAVNKAGQTPRSEGLKVRTKTAAFKFTLDPDTAHPDLDISDDGCSVTYDSAGSSRRNVPTRPERFTDYVAVLGNSVVSQGRHYWEIDVSKSRGYRIGVAYRSTPRNEYIGSNNSSWAIQCHNKRFALWHQNKSQTIQLSSPPSKIGILVDFSSGTLTCITMSQPGNKQQIYSFQTKFRESLCPAFAVWDNCLTVISGLPTPTI